MKLLDMYSWLLAQWINGGAFTRAGRLHATSIDAQYNMIFTKSNVKQIFRVSGIKPDNEDLAFVDYLRARMFELNPDIELIINIVQNPVKLSVNSDKFNRAFSKCSEQYQNYKDAFESQSGIARLTGKTYRLPGGGRLRLSKDRLDTLEQVYKSYEYLFNHISSGGTCSLVNIFIEVVGKDVRDVKRGAEDLFGILGSLNIGAEIVKSTNKAYLLENAPASPAPRTLNKKFLPQLLFTDENLAAWSTYKSRGLVGGGKNALLLGLDVRSRLPFSIDIFRSSAAQVFMLLGKSGSGKTYAAFQLAASALAKGHYVSAIDIKGREWIALDRIYDAKIITFDDRSPSFVNTLRLDDLDVDSSNAEELFNTAVKGTVQLFMLIINLRPEEGNVSDAELVIREAVLKLYSMRHVDSANINSFKNSANIRYADVLPVLETLATTNTYTEEQRHMVHLARARLNNYFGNSGIFSSAFRNEISLGDVLSSRFVIFELNKNQNTMQDNLDLVRIFMIQFLDSKKKSILKQQGKFLFCFYEELQRTAQFGNLLEYICADVTGSRSNNAVVILLLNSLKVLQGKEGQDIRSNITSLLVGLCEDNDIEAIDIEFNRPWLANQLRQIAAKQNIYRNSFACEIDDGVDILQTIYKVELPKYISEAFRTRTIKTEE